MGTHEVSTKTAYVKKEGRYITNKYISPSSRPRGRHPAGMQWSESQGKWVPSTKDLCVKREGAYITKIITHISKLPILAPPKDSTPNFS